jgi:hypothetical protein
MRQHWKSYWQAPGFRRLILAVALSFLIHLFFISELSIDLPTWENDTQSIEARLVLPKPTVTPAAPVKPKAKSLPKSNPVIQPEPAPVSETMNPPVSQPLPVEEAVTTPPEEPAPVESETPQEDAGLMINLDAYKYVETEFDVRTDPLAKVDSRPEGRAKITYQLLRNGEQYRLESLIQPIGLAALVIPDLLQTSEGFMSSTGLQPTQYLYQFGDKKDKTYRASMDWEHAKLQLQTSKATKEVPLVPGTQDMLSFMYQFMFIPPPQDMQLNITNGKKLDIYQYFFAGEEIIDTKNGKLRTVHIYRDNDDGDERSELWLAVDYQYVPVKIRKTEPENKVYELLATSIKTELPPESLP